MWIGGRKGKTFEASFEKFKEAKASAARKAFLGDIGLACRMDA
jgi:hypothetical protein